VSVGGSQQLRLFRRAIREGATLEQACAATGNIIGIEEGKIYLAADARNPPPEEAYALLYDPDAKAAASQSTKEMPMATAAKEEGENGGEYKRPDAAKAFDIYHKQIKPKLTKIDTARGELSQPWQDIKEHAHFPRPVMNFIISLGNIDDDAKRDHYLLALRDGLRHEKMFLPRDLVTMADGDDGEDLVDTEDRPGLRLVGIDDDEEAQPPSDDSDLADDEFTEATEEELARQEGLGGNDEAEEEQAEAAE
jgi:hypothetical protein